MLEILKILSTLDPGWKCSQVLAERNSDSGRGQYSGKRVRKILREKCKRIFWLCWVLVAAFGMFSCSIPDVVFWSGIEPGLCPLGAWTLNHWTTREVLPTPFNNLRKDYSPLTLHPLAWSQQQQMVFLLHVRHIDYGEMLIQTVSLGEKRTTNPYGKYLNNGSLHTPVYFKGKTRL